MKFRITLGGEYYANVGREILDLVAQKAGPFIAIPQPLAPRRPRAFNEWPRRLPLDGP
jgi:hypothetical protein